MAKTFYANGNTGVVAIMEGQKDMNVINNPEANVDKLYFHSDFDYFCLVGSLVGSFVLTQVIADDSDPSDVFGNRTYELGSITLDNPLLPVFVFGELSTGHTIVGDTFIQAGGTASLRSIVLGQSLVGNTLSIKIRETYLAKDYTLDSMNISYNIYALSISEETDTSKLFEITPTKFQASKGKLDISKLFLKHTNQGGIPFPEDRTLQLSDYGIAYDLASNAVATGRSSSPPNVYMELEI